MCIRDRDMGVFAYLDGELRSIVLEGDAAPVSAPGEEERVFHGFSDLAMTEAGDLYFHAAFEANAEGAGRGVFRVHDGVLEAVLLEGQQLPTHDGEHRTVLFGRRARGSFFDPNGVNASGEVAISVRFTDGTQAIYIATPVPEPAAWGLAAVALLLAGVARRRRSEGPPLSLIHI